MSERPKEGIYLDATLAVIGEQLDARIDELTRRRRTRSRFGVAALAVVALASGSVAAVAITTAGPDAAPAAAAHTEVADLHCIDGLDPARAAYFTVRYRVAPEMVVEDAATCAAAREAIAADGSLTEASPAELVGLADRLLEGNATRPEAENAPAPDAVSVEEASAGPLALVTGPLAPIVCTADAGTVVYLGAASDVAGKDRALLCTRSGR